MGIGRIIGLVIGTPLLVVFSLILSVFIFYGLIQLLKKRKIASFAVFVSERYLFGNRGDKSLWKSVWSAALRMIPRRRKSILTIAWSALMNLIFKRKKTIEAPSGNAINIITSISMLAIMVVTAALILVLSVFNGFQELIEDMYTSFDPDVRIEASVGKHFRGSDSLEKVIMATPGVEYVVPTIEEMAMLTYYDRQEKGVIKGVTQGHLNVDRLDQLVYDDGEYSFTSPEGFPTAVFGGTIAYYLNAQISDKTTPVKIWSVSHTVDPLKNPEQAMLSSSVFPVGYFKVQLDYDSKYVLMGFKDVRDLFQMGDKITAYEIKVKDFDRSQMVRDSLQARLGDQYKVLSWYDMHDDLFKVMQNEKLVAYLILTLMLMIAGVNIIGGLSMIVVEKTRDIGILRSMGASKKNIRRVFLTQGFLVGGIGGLAGIIAAFIFGFLHETVGLIPLAGGESFGELKFFPFEMMAMDFLVIFLTVFGLSILASLQPSAKAAKIIIVEALRK